MIKKLIFIMVLLLAGCTKSEWSTVTLLADGKEIPVQVEIADEAAEWQQGLMFREELDADKGMLFIFEEEMTQRFWMKNTLIPLDMIFVNADLIIIDIQEAEPCKTESCMVYVSAAPAQYVLEVNKGFSKENGINVGDLLILEK